MTDLKRALEEAVAAAFTAAGLSEDYARVTPSDRPDLADFQCNGALIAAKPSKRNPREIAIAVTEHLTGNPLLASVEIAGAGFINMRVSTAALSERASQVAADPRTGALRVAESRRVIIDYGGPNVAKPMHVGHLRSAIIGEAIKRIYRFRGDEVLGDAHFGDWGFQMGLLICAVSDADPRWKTVAEELWRTPDVKPHQEQKVVDDLLDGLDLDVLDRLYPLASTKAKADPEFRDRARKATAELQSGKPGYLTLWRRFVEVSREALKREYHTLGIDFDLWKGESDVEALIAPMVEDLKDKGLLEPDQGALIVRVDRNGETRPKKLADGTVITAPYPDPLLVVSSEGSAMYGTTDLATVLDRQKTYDPQLVLYCVDQRQAEHFEIVFRAAYLAKYAEPGALEHIGFGTMNGTDGKPFKTREGGVLKLRDLIGMTTEKASDRLHEAGLGAELPPKEFEDIARKVAVAALKFADLQNFRGTSYVFDLDRFSSFEGKTGPYLLYQAVRIKSILRRVEAQGASNLATVIIAEPAERELALLLDAFGHAVAEAYDRKAPHFIAEHAFRLAQGFSKFYAACPVLNAPAAIKASRLALSATVLRQLETALDLLGIETPERM